MATAPKGRVIGWMMVLEVWRLLENIMKFPFKSFDNVDEDTVYSKAFIFCTKKQKVV